MMLAAFIAMFTAVLGMIVGFVIGNKSREHELDHAARVGLIEINGERYFLYPCSLYTQNVQNVAHTHDPSHSK